MCIGQRDAADQPHLVNCWSYTVKRSTSLTLLNSEYILNERTLLLVFSDCNSEYKNLPGASPEPHSALLHWIGSLNFYLCLFRC